MSDTKVKSSNLILSALNQAIIPDTNEAYDLGTAEKKFRDLYLSTGTIYMGDNSVSIDSDGRLSYSRTVDGATKTSAMPEVDLNIAPEVLGIQVQANDAGDNIMWKWTWTQSSLPYSRIDITNETQLSVPLYNKGTYTIDNYAAHETYDDMTQTHKGYFKWVEGAGTDNLVSWATYTENVSTSISTINDGNSTEVQRYSFTVPDTITLPTLTQPSGIGYDVSFSTTGAYTFGANASSGSDMDSVAEGDNPTLGPLYRGSTYTFYLDSSLASHPFYLTTDNGRNFVSGSYVSEYTDGVTGSRNNGSSGKETLTFTVPSDAPDELYYQCGTHSAMRGAITIKDLEVKENDNGNYVVYFQHTHEGHATEIELRPIPSLVNQMCLVYDSSTGKFVPQDLATYVENTPSFKRKIRDVSGTAELVVADGSTVIAKVNVYPDSTYLPLTNINQGDQAFATDTNILYIWDGSDWQQAGASNSDDLTEGSTNIFYTNTRVDDRVDTLLGSGGSIKSAIDTAVSDLIDSSPGALDTLNELAAAIGDDANFASTVTTSIATKADKTRTISAGTGLTGGGDLTADRTLSLGTSGVSAGTYGSASAVPVLTIDTYGRITSASTTAVAGVSSVSYTASTGVLTINTSNGSTYTNDLGIGTGDSPTFAGLTLTGDIAVNGGDITSSTGAISFGNENLSTTGNLTTGDITISSAQPILNLNDSNNGSGGGYTGYIAFNNTSTESFRIGDWAAVNENYGPDILRIQNTNGTRIHVQFGSSGSTAGNLYIAGNRALTTADEGSGNGLDADTVDGLQASQFLRSDADDTTTGNLTFNSSANEKIILGGSANPFIRWQESTTDRAYIQWNASADGLYYTNQQAGGHTFYGGTTVTNPPRIAIRAQNQSTTGPGNIYAQLQFEVQNAGGVVASGINGTDVNTIAMITAQDFRNGTGKTNEDSGLGFYTTPSGGSLTYRGGISNAGNWFIGTGNNDSSSNGLLNVGGDLYVSGNINVGSQVGTWVTSNVMADAIGWNTSYGVYIGSDIGGTHYLRGNGTFTTNGSTYNLWHQGNDGSGSGLDADTVDGLQASQFLRSDASDSTTGSLTVGGDLVVSGGVLTLNNLELTENPPAYSIWLDANDADAPATLGNYASSWPLGIYVNGDGALSGGTLGSGAVQVYHTGHFTGTHISNWQTAYGWGNHANGGYATKSGANSFTNSYNEFGNSTGSVSNDGNWNARVNVAGSSHARIDAKSVSDGIITTIYAHTGHNAGKVGTMSNHAVKFMTGGTDRVTLDTSGNMTVSGIVTANSDVRLKSDIQTITHAVDTVKALRGTAYIKDGKASIGVIAQEVEEVLPQLVHTADDEMGTKSVAYGNMVGLLIEAIKEQQEQIDELKRLLETK